MFWVDLALHNPFDTDINLSNLTAIISDSRDKETLVSSPGVEVETLSDVLFTAGETCVVSSNYPDNTNSVNLYCIDPSQSSRPSSRCLLSHSDHIYIFVTSGCI